MNVKRKSRILIVDDEPLNVDVIEQKLERLGYFTESAADGQEALEKVASNPPDLILLDIMMPRVDGFTVCRMLKDDPATRLIPIVIMTVLNDKEDRIKGIEAGADDFLTKPVNDRELKARIKTALRLKQTLDEKLEELKSARAQLARFGRREQDVSVLVISLSSAGRAGEALAPAALEFLIERYLSSLTELIDAEVGQIADTPGQSLMVVFPDPDPKRHPVTALETAFDLVAETQALNKENNVGPLEVHVGISSGRALLGSVRARDEDTAGWTFAATGDVPDLAMRLAAVAKDGEVVAGPETVSRLQDRYRLRRLRGKRVKEQVGRVTVHRVLGPSPDPGPGPSSKAFDSKREAEDVSVDGGGERRGMPWPDAFRDLYSPVRMGWGVEGEIFLSRILSGKSGALVYAVDITCRDYKGQAILKLAEALNSEWSEEDEAERHRRAVENNSDYAGLHLPKIVHTCQHDGQIAILSTIAGRGLEYTVPWALCHYRPQLDSIRQLSNGILEDWNANYELADGMQPPADLLRSWLGYRLDPDAGRIHDFLSGHCDLHSDDCTFFFHGNWFPNPLAFVDGPGALPERLKLRAVKGNIHGDLHGLNILVRFREDDDINYFLIDLALYSDSQFLFYDHAYLELSYLLQTRESASLARWKLVLDAISHRASGLSAATADDLGVTQLLSALRNEVFQWIDKHEAHRLSYLESQYLLARVAAGLNFTNKRMAARNRVFAFLYGAANLRDYLTFQDIDWPKQGPVLQFRDEAH